MILPMELMRFLPLVDRKLVLEEWFGERLILGRYCSGRLLDVFRNFFRGICFDVFLDFFSFEKEKEKRKEKRKRKKMSIGSVRSSLFSVSPFLLRSTSSSTTTRFSPLLASSSSSNCLNSFRVSSQSFSPLSSSFSSTSSSSSSSSSLSLLRIQNERNQKMSFVPSSGSCYDYHYRRMGFWNEFKVRERKR